MESNSLSQSSDTFAVTENPNCSLITPYAELINKTTGEVYSLRNELESIGRSFSALISLKDIDVSRRHCYFSKHSENLCGLTSVGRTGTIVNGVVCPPNTEVMLNTGDEIKISANEFIFKYITYSPATAMENSALDESIKSIEERRSVFEYSQYLEKEKLNNWFRNLQEKNSEDIQNFEKIISQCSSKNDTKPEETDKEKEALRKEMKAMQDEFERMKEEWAKQQKLLEDRLLEQKKEFEEKLALEVLVQTTHQDKKLNGLKRTADHFKNEYEMSEQTKIKLEKENDKVKEQLKQKELEFKEREAKSMLECVGRDLECGICSELCVEPMLLNCGHLFCKFCISMWKKKKKECPMCRTKIKNEIRNWSFDSIIEKVMKYLPEEEKKQREKLVNERKGQVSSKSSSSRSKEPIASTSIASTGPPFSINNFLGMPSARPRSTQNAVGFPSDLQEIDDVFRWVEPMRHHSYTVPVLLSALRSNPDDSVIFVDEEVNHSTVDLTRLSNNNLMNMPGEVAVDLTNRPVNTPVNWLTVEEIDLTTSPATPVSSLRR